MFRQWAWGQDELRPESREGRQWMQLGLTIVDSLVTFNSVALPLHEKPDSENIERP